MDRTELERELRRLCVPHQDEGCAHCDDRIAAVMRLVDAYTDAPASGRKCVLWTARQVADHAGFASDDAARSRLSKKGIKAVDHKRMENGRYAALYPADRVREEWPPRTQSRLRRPQARAGKEEMAGTQVNTITYTKGDATHPQGDGKKIIAHICNDLGGWGKGFVLALSERSPLPEKAYRTWFREPDYEVEPFALGSVQFTGYATPDTLVVNMIAQRGIRRSDTEPPAVDYAALRRCLDKAAYGAEALGASVHMPRIGCGPAGGRWDIIEPIITQSLITRGIPVTVYDL